MDLVGVEPDLVEFAFESEAIAGLPPAVLVRLARQTWSFNRRMGLTGAFSLRDKTFTEVIEGPCAVVQPLAARILADRRHGLIQITAFRPLEARRHADWTVTGFDFAPETAVAASASAANLHFLPLGEKRRAVAVLPLTAERRSV